jgi:transcriptional antiterminator NusG
MSTLESGRDNTHPESAAADGVSTDQTAEAPKVATEPDVESSGTQEEQAKEDDGGVETPEAVVDAPPETAPEAPAEPAVDVSAEAAGKTAARVKAPAKSAEGHRWYIVHTYSGFENKVKETLQQRIEALDMSKEIGEILIPSEEVVDVREGRKRRSTRKFFPGYLLVNMNMSDAAWHVVKDTPKVTGFVGTGTLPVPLQDGEVERIVKQIVIAAEKPKPKLEYSVGESVRIVDGPFSNFTGQVEEVNQDRLTLKVMVTIFGRATPVELEFLQVQKP